MKITGTKPSVWHRIITGVIGLPLASLGLVLVVTGVAGWVIGCSGAFAAAGAFNARPVATYHPCDLLPGLVVTLGVGMAFVGVPFAIAMVVPYGTFRRGLVGLGVAAAGGIVSAVILLLIDDGVAVILVLPAAAAFFYMGYRLAR